MQAYRGTQTQGAYLSLWDVHSSSKYHVCESDKDVLQLTNDCKGFEIVEIYVKHVIDVPIIGEEFVNEGGSDFVTIDDSDSGGEGDVQRKGVGDVSDANAQGECDHVVVADVEGEGDVVVVHGECDAQGEGHVQGEGDTNSFEDEDYVAEENSNNEYTSMEDSDYEENWDWTIVLDTDLFGETKPPFSHPPPGTTIIILRPMWLPVIAPLGSQASHATLPISQTSFGRSTCHNVSESTPQTMY
ncbi:hypothetical protein D0Y65_009519 [Glycine soja]|uniref:Uncharacterized protein n=1 Tax=Glycine soja TaxID=3848 RepID=A0A445KZP8_GLYSO|nr:hypothetical protein D0Y65_009519 [Glycine soja]